MKKLFLTSYAVRSLDLIVRYLPHSPADLKVAFIPTAASLYENKDFVLLDRNKLLELGFAVEDVELEKTRRVDLEKVLQRFDVIFVAGGNTFYLLDQVRKSGLDQLLPQLLDSGKIYIGSSAGSVLCGPTIEGVKKFDSPADAPDLSDFSGLNFFDFCIFPHAQKEKYASRIKQAEAEMAAQGYKTLRLTDDQIVMVIDDKFQLLS